MQMTAHLRFGGMTTKAAQLLGHSDMIDGPCHIACIVDTALHHR
jgi:hypothetical protein